MANLWERSVPLKHYRPGVGKLWTPPTHFVWLPHTDMLICLHIIYWLLPPYKGGVEYLWERPYVASWLIKLKIFTILPFKKKFADLQDPLWARHCLTNICLSHFLCPIVCCSQARSQAEHYTHHLLPCSIHWKCFSFLHLAKSYIHCKRQQKWTKLV